MRWRVELQEQAFWNRGGRKFRQRMREKTDGERSLDREWEKKTDGEKEEFFARGGVSLEGGGHRKFYPRFNGPKYIISLHAFTSIESKRKTVLSHSNPQFYEFEWMEGRNTLTNDYCTCYLLLLLRLSLLLNATVVELLNANCHWNLSLELVIGTCIPLILPRLTNIEILIYCSL